MKALFTKGRKNLLHPSNLVIFAAIVLLLLSAGGPQAYATDSKAKIRELASQAVDAHKNGQNAAALRLIDQALQMDARHPLALTVKAKVLVGMQRFQEAHQVATLAIQLEPAWMAPYYIRGRASLALSNYQEAFQDFTISQQKKPSHYDSIYLRSLALRGLGRHQEAIDEAARALNLKPDLARARILQGESAISLGMLDKAGKYASLAISASQANKSLRLEARSLLLLGKVLFKQGKYQEARGPLSQAIQLNPKYAHAYYMRGASFFKQGLREQALKDVQSAIRLDPGNKIYQQALAKLKNAGFAQKSATPDKPKDQQVLAGTKQTDSNTIKAATLPQTTVVTPTALEPGALILPPEEPEPSVSIILDKQASLNLADPCGEIKLTPEAAPDQAKPQPADLLKTPLARTISGLSHTQYQGVVSTAMEATRLAMGLVTPQVEESFQKAWAPLFDFPSRRVVAYLDKLNPLLVEFLGLREAIGVSLANFEYLRFEAEMAANWGADGDADSYIHQIGAMLPALKQQQARLKKVAQAVKSLGDPPNPQEDKCRARRNFKDALDALKPPGQGAWVLSKTWTQTLNKMAHETITTNQVDFKDNHGVALSVVPQKNLFSKQYYDKWPDMIIRWAFGFSPPPKALGPDQRLMISGYLADAGTTYLGHAQLTGILTSTHPVFDYALVGQVMHTLKPEHKINGVYRSQALQSYELGGLKQKWPGMSKNRAGKYPPWSKGFKAMPDMSKPKEPQFAFRQIKRGEKDWTFTLEVRIRSNYITWAVYYQYTFDPLAPTPDPMPLPRQFTLKDNKIAQEPFKIVKTASKTKNAAEEPTEADLKKQKIEYHQNQIKILQEDITRYQAILAKAKDPAGRAPIENLLLGKTADIQGQLDAIAFIQSGNYVRTRTGWDEMVAGQMRANSRQEAAELMKPFTSIQTMERVFTLLPPKDRLQNRSWAEKSWREAGDDPAKRKAVVRAIAKRAASLNQAEAYLAEAEAANATGVIDTLESYQYMAHLTMYAAPFVVGASPVAMAYGFASGAISGYHGQDMIGAGYKGATGAAINSVVSAASYLAPSVDYVLSFYHGATQLDDKGNPAGVWGGVKAAGMTFIERKAMQYVTLGTQRFMARNQLGRSMAGMTKPAQNAQRSQAFKAQRQQGKRLVEQHQTVYQEYKALKKTGGKPYKLKALENKLMDLTAEIKQQPHAKGYLKFAATPEQQYAYNSTSTLHTKRVTQAFKTELIRQGVDTEGFDFKPIRNTGNTSPGMDLDLAVFTKNTHVRVKDPNSPGGYKTIDLYRGNKLFQKVFNKVYSRESGGRSAEKSWQMVTTNQHVEAYSDMAWLSVKKRGQSGNVPTDPRLAKLSGVSQTSGDSLSQINPQYAGQAARVTEVKAHEMRLQAERSRGNQNWEIYRGTSKDIKSKVLPNILQRIKNTNSASTRAKLRSNYEYYKKLSAAMDLHNHDPVDSEHSVKEITGFDDPVDVTSMVSAGIESLGKWK